MNAIVLPSGDQRGDVSEAWADVSCLIVLPSIDVSQRFVVTLFVVAFQFLRVKTTHRPSGEGRGSPRRSMATMSFTENGTGPVVLAAAAGIAAASARAPIDPFMNLMIP